MPHSNVYLSDGKRERKKRRFYLAAAGAAAFVYLLAVAAGWFFLRSPFFTVKDVEVVGNKDIKKSEILSVIYSRVLGGSVWRSLLGVDNMLIWPEKLSGGDLVFLPKAESVELRKDYGSGSVTVEVREREPYGVWCLRTRMDADKETHAVAEGDKCWWFDKEGIVFKRGVSARGSLITVVSDYSQEKIGLRSRILPEEFVRNAFSVFDVLRMSSLGVKDIRLNDLKLEELEVLTFDGPKLFFSLRFPAENALETIRRISAKSGFNNLEYVDFRVENRVYYK